MSQPLNHIERKQLPFTPEHMFHLVAAVDKYKAFAPWCVASRINKWESDRVFYADLVVGYKMFRETFSSKVFLEPAEGDTPARIYIEYMDGPLQALQNEWRFTRAEDGSCIIDFAVTFSFKNKMFQGLVDMFFNEVVSRMISAFEARAHELYEPIS